MPQDGDSGTGGVRVAFTRALIVVVTMALMAAAAAGGYAAAERLDFMPSGGVAKAEPAGIVVDTPVVSFEMPDQPEVTEATTVDGEVAVLITSWVVSLPDMEIMVQASNFSELMQQQALVPTSVYDTLVADLVAGSDATVTSSTDVTVGADGARHVTLRSAERSAFVYMVLHGGTLLSVIVETPGDAPPPEYDEIVATVVWKS